VQRAPDSGRGTSPNAVHVDEVEAEVSDLFQDPVQCGLVGDPTAQAGLIGSRRGHLEAFEGALQAGADPPLHDQLVLHWLLGHVPRIVLWQPEPGITPAG
jgi:hypothetical protein